MNIAEILGKLAALNPANPAVGHTISSLRNVRQQAQQGQPQVGVSDTAHTTPLSMIPQSSFDVTQPDAKTTLNLSGSTVPKTPPASSPAASNTPARSNPQDVSSFANSLYSSLQTTQPPQQQGTFVYQNPQSGMSAIDQLSALQAQQAQERATGQGIYKVDESMRLSPQQIEQIRGSGDAFYKEQLGKVGAMAQSELAKSKSTGSSSLLGSGTFGSDLDATVAKAVATIPTKFKQEAFVNAMSRARNDADKISIMASTVLANADAPTRTDFINQSVAIKQIDKAIKAIEEGAQTGFLNNGAQYTFNLFGKDYDPNLAKVASYITSAVQPYRNSITGAAWGNQEDTEYQALFGSTKYSPEELLSRLERVKEIMIDKSIGALDAEIDPLGALQGDSTFGGSMTETLTPDEIEFLRNEGYSNEEIKSISFSQVGNTSASISKAIAEQESSNNYQAVNKDSGALGKYQIMPATLKGLGYNVSDQEFLRNPRLQEEAHAKLIAELDKRYNGNIDKILADYYGGPRMARIVGTPKADIPQGEYPSVNQYVAQVKQKLNLA